MMQSFNFKNLLYEDYIIEMSKFINLSENRHLQFCFNIFDFNKDKAICYKDTFTALELRTHNYYDSDLAIIKEMLILKKEGKLDSKMLRRKSTFSLIKEKIAQKRHITLEKLTPRKEGSETISINFKEFSIIKFDGRPQIIRDFISYTFDYNYLAEKGLLVPQPPHSNKNSETIVVEMNINSNFHEIIRKHDKYEYYCELDAAMALYPQKELESMLKKFKYLQSEDKLKYKVITKESMIAKLVSFI